MLWIRHLFMHSCRVPKEVSSHPWKFSPTDVFTCRCMVVMFGPFNSGGCLGPMPFDDSIGTFTCGHCCRLKFLFTSLFQNALPKCPWLCSVSHFFVSSSQILLQSLRRNAFWKGRLLPIFFVQQVGSRRSRIFLGWTLSEAWVQLELCSPILRLGPILPFEPGLFLLDLLVLPSLDKWNSITYVSGEVSYALLVLVIYSVPFL